VFALLLAVAWTVGVLISLWTQRNLLESAIEALARNDAMANLRKDMAIRRWAASMGGVWVDETRAGANPKLTEQERLTTIPTANQPAKLVLLTPIHILMGIQQSHEAEYGVKERLTSLQLRNSENEPDNWERDALQRLKEGAPLVSTVQQNTGGHGLLRLMIPMRMDEECLECHRDTLVPVGGLRGGATIAIDLNRYRSAQEPTWRGIQIWHGGIWLFGMLAIGGLHGALRRRGAERAAIEEERKETALAFAAMNEGALITDAEAKILWVNDAACAITGYGRAELVGANTRLFKSGRHAPEFYAQMWQQLSDAGHWEGEVWNRRKNKSIFPEELSIRALRNAAGRPRRFVAILSDISERKLRDERISRLALRDMLTDLPNRNLLEEIAPKLLAQAEREANTGGGCAALFFDLDHFKEVNDSLGHEAGDRLLVEAAARLRSCFRNGDLLVRMGGDEFVALIGPDPAIADLAATIAQRAIAALSLAFVIDNVRFALGVSIGIALAPADGSNWKELAKNADTALFVAKKGGRNRWSFFAPAMNAGELARAQLRSAVIGAIDARELFLVYQPQVDLASGRLTGFEALIRWRRGDQILAPAAFLPMVENTWIMRSIGTLVVQLATEQIDAWRRQGLAPPPVFINASPEDLASGEFCTLLSGFCAVLDVPHASIGVEVLEAALDSETAEAEILALHQAGFSIAIDDFGTGYSSLSRLHRLPIAKLKLDRSFIARLPDDAKAVAVTRATASVAHELGIVMIAEGIETEAQRNCLRELECPLGQGWLFGHPEIADSAGRRCPAAHRATAL
jgi:diguanylate cyclase (GGDEF)-like protein/PAS domain S-box-containing protein